LFYINKSYPFNLQKSLLNLVNGSYEFKIRVCDDIDNCSEQLFNINIKTSQKNKTGDIVLSWASPANNQKIKEKEFPVSMRINIVNPEEAAKLNLFVFKGDEKKQIASINYIENNIIESYWTPEEIGDYKLKAEALNWAGKNFESDFLNLSIVK
jgi:hypothetical protein